jgi:hypothetical protein
MILEDFLGIKVIPMGEWALVVCHKEIHLWNPAFYS